MLGGAVLFAAAIVLSRPGLAHSAGLFARWIIFDARMKLSLEQDASVPGPYGATGRGPLALAGVVREFRAAWPDQSAAGVNGAAGEVATALLHHRDIEIGDIEAGKFVPWRQSPWEAAGRINAELMARKEFFSDETHGVFRRKPEMADRPKN